MPRNLTIKLSKAIPSIVVCLLLTALASHQVVAQTDQETESVPPITAESVQQKIAAAKSSTSLDEATRTNLIGTYQKQLVEIAKTPGIRTSLQKFQADREAIPALIEQRKKELAQATSQAPAQDSFESLNQAEGALDTAQQNLATFKTKLETLEAEQRRRQTRRVDAIPNLINATVEQRTEIQKKKTEASDSDVTIKEATGDWLRLQEANLDLQVEVLKAEQSYYEAAADVLSLDIQIATAKGKIAEKRVNDLQQTTERLRRQSVHEASRESISQISQTSEELVDVAKLNSMMTKKLRELSDAITVERKQLNDKSKRYENLSKQFKERQEEKKRKGRISDAKGQMLWVILRQDLSDERTLSRQASARKKLIEKTRNELDMVRERLKELATPADIDALVAQKMQSFSNERAKQLEPEYRKLLENQQKNLTELEGFLKSYRDALLSLNVRDSELLAVIENFKSLIGEQVFWVRSIPSIYQTLKPRQPADWLASQEDESASFLHSNGLTFLFSLHHWQILVKAVVREFANRGISNLGAIVSILVLAVYRWRVRGRIPKLGEMAQAGTCCKFVLTTETLIITLLRSLIWPIIFGWIAWNLLQLDETVALARPMAGALGVIAVLLYSFLLWLRILRPGGLAQAHFDWSEHVVNVSKYHLRWLMFILVPVAGLFYFFRQAGYEPLEARFCFIVGVCAITVFLYFYASPSRGVLREYLSVNRDGTLYRTRKLWFPALLLLPVILAILSLLGYQYTASELAVEVFYSIVVCSFIYLVAATSLRWVKIKRRSLAIEQARERLAALSQSAGQESGSEPAAALESETLDLTTVNRQTRRIIWSFSVVAAMIGLYLIWIDVLPALNRVNDIRLWQTSSYEQAESPSKPVNPVSTLTGTTPETTEKTNSSNGQSTETFVTSTQTVYRWVTLGDLLACILIIALTIVAIQNIPGLLEITILQRLPFDAALRFAITTVTRYCIIIMGIVWAFSSVGIGWSKVQFLAAAISVGLGFGLQEIFANFISGLILLFERPLRAGDIVTVGDTSGTVVQIKTRATTIQDWDRKLLIVPNKEFITGRVLNWTLAETVNRIVVPVGVAYGSDIAETRKIILQIANDQRLIVDEPKPSVTFEMFGDSTLNFNLRAYFRVADIEFRLDIIHELNEAIHDQLQQAGIEIAFPQRDLRIRSVDAPFVIQSEPQPQKRDTNDHT